MRQIREYELGTCNGVMTLSISRDVKYDSFMNQFLSISIKNGKPLMWCIEDNERSKRDVRLLVIGNNLSTYHIKKENYLGSYLYDTLNIDGEVFTFVGHVFLFSD